MRIALDVDEVLARLHAPWIRWACAVYPHLEGRLTHFESWEQPGELGLLDFVQPAVYDDDVVLPYLDARWVTTWLREHGHTVLFATTCINGTEDAKRRWLRRHGLMRDAQEFWPCESSKAHVPADVLVDDAPHFLEDFPGWRIMVTRPHNCGAMFLGRRITDVGELPFLLGARPLPV